MHPKALLNQCLLKLTGSPGAVRFLERVVSKSLYLSGIGSGDDPQLSGEKVVVQLLAQAGDGPFCIFDVGANNGQYLRMLRANLPHQNYTVHCFEPGAVCFGRLSDGFGDDDKVRLNNLALGDQCGQATLYYDRAGSELGSLTKRDLSHLGRSFDESETVEISTLDDYCAQNGIEKIHLLKIDVEGHELDVLRGAQRMLREGRVDLVAYEFGNLDARVYFRDMFNFFAGHGMATYRILPAGRLYPIENYKHIYEQFTTTNYLSVKKGIDPLA